MTTNDPFLDTIVRLITPLVADAGAELYDIERSGPTVRITVDRRGGIDLDALATINRSLSRALDETDSGDEAYVLEVSSPGLERALRTPSHWERAVGERVKVKTTRDIDGARRFDGAVVGCSDSVIVIGVDNTTISIPLDAVDRAKTVFEWGPTPKPGGAKPGPKSTKPAASKPNAAPAQPESQAALESQETSEPQETQEASQ